MACPASTRTIGRTWPTPPGAAGWKCSSPADPACVDYKLFPWFPGETAAIQRRKCQVTRISPLRAGLFLTLAAGLLTSCANPNADRAAEARQVLVGMPKE